MDGFAVDTGEGAKFPDRGRATPRHSPGDPARARAYPVLAVLEGDRKQTGVILAAGNAPVARIPDLAKTPSTALTLDLEAPPARAAAADPAQGGPRPHDKPDRRHGEIHLVDQQCRLDQERPAIADRQWRTGRAGHRQPDRDAASDASARSRVPGRRDRRQALSRARCATRCWCRPNRRVVIAFDANNPGFGPSTAICSTISTPACLRHFAYV